MLLPEEVMVIKSLVGSEIHKLSLRDLPATQRIHESGVTF